MAKVRKRKKSARSAAESAETPRASLGERLRQARQAKGLDTAVVAERLHLKQALVIALEEEDWERLPARVFVRGYYRNYARLLELPEGPLLEAFDSQCPEGEECAGAPPVVAQGVRKEIRSSHGLVRLMTWIVVISLIAAFALWWQDRAGRRAEEGQPVTAGAPAPRQEESTPPPSPQVTAEPPVEAAARAAPSELPGEPEASAASQAEVETTVPVPLQAAPVNAPAVSEQDHTETGNIAKAVPPAVELHFTEDSWVDLRDSSGRFKVVGIRKAGEVVKLEGEPPYHMILGNARGVRLLVNGKPYDFSNRTRRNVARLTLNP